jgi:hypothetical protein
MNSFKVLFVRFLFFHSRLEAKGVCVGWGAKMMQGAERPAGNFISEEKMEASDTTYSEIKIVLCLPSPTNPSLKEVKTVFHSPWFENVEGVF